ncbi:1,4-alpha-glucan branching protein GlgB [Sporomusa sp. KB1]|jgi:1,4-alpha-glucan branching enzyme|uniref:1,4-alpha-glucan branching protein GlgB n=1 Tax=Sporomusa sp. KB1 TaxID=943346 RepID=UPI0011A8490B|nr:1,4-alpha-glucan branching protein GlgB [Sporomusa sp. KB1]TWH46720.1 1,4-alpha-glucan branching enzyme [Sporomusa sp. KB1]
MTAACFSDQELYLFHEGTLQRSYRLLGAHVAADGHGVRFTVWAPNAQAVRVIGDFNNWNGSRHGMERISTCGVWGLVIPGVTVGDSYKYEIITAGGEILHKADPYAFAAEIRPKTASKVACLAGYTWQDAAWRENKSKQSLYEQPMNIYEVDLGSWKRDSDRQWLSYRELAPELADYAANMGYTHIELLPVAEHPFDGSWGYQATGYYAVTSRYGLPEDFMFLVDCCHRRGIGVILDWVPGHFCKDAHGLAAFDGTTLYEYADSNRKENRGWGTLNFDLGRPEVMSFLISNVLFWMELYHIDGIRIDAVANMLYLNYGKEDGEWTPNCHGGAENLEAISFLRRLNEAVFASFPAALVIAEDSTAWPLVTHPTYLGGLGFNFKWNMGWMNDMLRYMELDPLQRQYHHNLITFSFMYAFSENFVLPLSHDEVVHGKRSLLDKMPGDYWQKFANLRAFYAYMMAHPGKKLLFMGGEFGQFIEWNYQDSLDWHLLDYEMHGKLHNYVRDLNHFYLENPAMWQNDRDWRGFSWIDCQDWQQSVLVFKRQGLQADDFIIAVVNFTPVVRLEYRIGVPEAEYYLEVLNSDSLIYGGSGQGNTGKRVPVAVACHNQPNSLVITLPPLATVYFKPIGCRKQYTIGSEALCAVKNALP